MNKLFLTILLGVSTFAVATFTFANQIYLHTDDSVAKFGVFSLQYQACGSGTNDCTDVLTKEITPQGGTILQKIEFDTSYDHVFVSGIKYIDGSIYQSYLSMPANSVIGFSAFQVDGSNRIMLYNKGDLGTKISQ